MGSGTVLPAGEDVVAPPRGGVEAPIPHVQANVPAACCCVGVGQGPGLGLARRTPPGDRQADIVIAKWLVSQREPRVERARSGEAPGPGKT